MPYNQQLIISGYTPPVYRKGKSCYIEYYVQDLANPTASKRKRIKLNRIAEADRDDYAKKTIKDLKKKLKQGWHPDKGFAISKEKSIVEAIEFYKKVKQKQFEYKEIRPDTWRSIKSFTKQMLEWIHSNKLQFYTMKSFTRNIAVAYMNYIFFEKEVSAKTYNNYLNSSKTIFNFFIEEEMIIENPFAKIKTKALKNKSERVPLTFEERIEIKKYLLKENKHFLLCCMLIFHSGLRRTELTKIKISDIDLKNQVIQVSSNVAKMNKKRFASMPPEVIELMMELNVFDAPGRYALIGVNWEPSDIAISPKKLSDTWANMRNALKLHPKAQLYSLRKTGGIQKAEDKMSVQAIKDFFGHVSLDAAVHYFENHRNKGNAELKQGISKF